MTPTPQIGLKESSPMLNTYLSLSGVNVLNNHLSLHTWFIATDSIIFLVSSNVLFSNTSELGILNTFIGFRVVNMKCNFFWQQLKSLPSNFSSLLNFVSKSWIDSTITTKQEMSARLLGSSRVMVETNIPNGSHDFSF